MLEKKSCSVVINSSSESSVLKISRMIFLFMLISEVLNVGIGIELLARLVAFREISIFTLSLTLEQLIYLLAFIDAGIYAFKVFARVLCLYSKCSSYYKARMFEISSRYYLFSILFELFVIFFFIIAFCLLSGFITTGLGTVLDYYISWITVVLGLLMMWIVDYDMQKETLKGNILFLQSIDIANGSAIVEKVKTLASYKLVGFYEKYFTKIDEEIKGKLINLLIEWYKELEDIFKKKSKAFLFVILGLVFLFLGDFVEGLLTLFFEFTHESTIAGLACDVFNYSTFLATATLVALFIYRYMICKKVDQDAFVKKASEVTQNQSDNNDDLIRNLLLEDINNTFFSSPLTFA